MLQQRIYNNLPVPFQNLACTLKGIREKKLRLSGKFNDYLDFLKQSEWYSPGEIEEYQNIKLAELIKYSYTNVPYYNDLFKKHRLQPSDIVSVNDLEKIPLLTKEDVRNNARRLLSRAMRKSEYVEGHTSGSTGKALHFYHSKDLIKWRTAVWFRHKGRFGTLPNDPYATFTGLPAIPLTQQHPPYWRENYAMKQTIFTMHHINPKTIKPVVERLNRGYFQYYTGYPSILLALADYMEEAGLELASPPKMIFTGAETLQESQRARISSVLKARVSDLYGFTEGAGNASRCERDLYHEDFEYGILECYDGKDEGNERTGTVIATGLTNFAMPLIRYEVGDTATWLKEKCSCGRHSKTIARVEGRSEDFIITPEGNKILRFDYIFKNLMNIKEAQVVQYRLNELVIRIVQREHYSTKDEKQLIQEVKEKVSPGFKVNFEYVTEIEKESRGKFRAVKSYLNRS